MNQTIVRIAELSPEDASFLVDWKPDGEFTVTLDHPLSIEYRNLESQRRYTTLIVASTTEIEWCIQTIEWTKDACTFKCAPRHQLVRTCTIPDEALVELGMVA